MQADDNEAAVQGPDVDRDAFAANIRRSVAAPLKARIAELEAELAAARTDAAAIAPTPTRWGDLTPEQQRAELALTATWTEHLVWRQVYETRTHQEWIATGRDWTKGTP